VVGIIDNPAALELAWRLIGAFLGASVSLFIVPVQPRTGGGLWRRGLSSLVFGVVFADVAAEQMGWSIHNPSRVIAASFVAAFLGWFVAHAAIRLIQSRGER